MAATQKKFIFVLAILSAVAIANMATAQNETSDTSNTKSFADRLDDFGRAVFGGRPAEKSKPKAKDSSTPTEKNDVADPPSNVDVADNSASVSANMNEPSPAAATPLHTRLSGYQKSAFDVSVTPTTTTAPTALPNSKQSKPSAEFGAADAGPQLSPQQPSASSPKQASPEGLQLARRSPPAKLDNAQAVTREVDIASASSAASAKRLASPKAANSVLVDHKSPNISVETVGPRTIAVGKESAYQVQVSNTGEVAAEDLVLHVTLPDWTEVAGFEASVGSAQANEAVQTAGPIVWKVGKLGANSNERLTIKLIPRQSRPFDLAVRWDYKPIASQAMIEVQEPKFALAIEGPHEVFYGKKETYRLKLKNTGDGAAENVMIMLTPIGTSENVPASHKIGVLAAGEEKALDIELTARQPGNVTIQADVRADGGAHAELSEKVVVRRGELKIDVDGTKVQFVGGVATYNVHVRNVGNAAMRNLTLTIMLPADSKYLSGIEGAKFNTSTGRLEWHVEHLNPEVEQSFTLKCALVTPGISRIRLGIVAADDLFASAETTVQVDSIANLTMDVKDPVGPSLVGEETVYEIHVRNRGTKEAQDVQVFAYFSRGIEPTSAEGAPNRLGAGQVAFQPMVSLAPGAEAVLKIHAKAELPGNHVFRAETHCKALGTRLMSEATNLYYGDGPAVAQTAQNTAAASAPSAPAIGSAAKAETVAAKP